LPAGAGGVSSGSSSAGFGWPRWGGWPTVTGISVERLPGGSVLVAGLLAHPDVIEALAEAFVQAQATDDRLDLPRLFEQVVEFGQARLDVPEGSLEDQVYNAAFDKLTGLLESAVVTFAPRDLGLAVEAMTAERTDGLVTA
jgi:hypothetical protein